MYMPDISEIDMGKTKRTEEIFLRDPCVLVYEGYYFMYGTGAAAGLGYGCYVSTDLENWAGPVNVFSAPAGFDGINNFWAPECHYYKGSFYLFATYLSAFTGHRGVSIFKADNPLGPFEEITNGHITPHEWDAIDGTLFVDQSGQPWMVFVHEWTNTANGIGDMSAAKLSEDLTHFISEPVILFTADKLPSGSSNRVTDGPWLHTSSTGELLMIWSGFTDKGYCVATARSKNGKIDGSWKQNSRLLYKKNNKEYAYDGGHGMMFTDLQGRLMLAIHSPNGVDGVITAPAFYELVDEGKTLTLKADAEHREETIQTVKNVFKGLASLTIVILGIYVPALQPLWDLIGRVTN